MRGRRPRGRSGGARTPIARASSAPRHAAGASAVSRRNPGDRCPLLFSTSAGRRLAAGCRGHAAHIIIKMIEITTRRRHKADPGTPGAAAHLRRRFWVRRARAARGPGPTPTAPPATAPRTSPGWGARAACARARGLSRLYTPPRRGPSRTVGSPNHACNERVHPPPSAGSYINRSTTRECAVPLAFRHLDQNTHAAHTART